MISASNAKPGLDGVEMLQHGETVVTCSAYRLGWKTVLVKQLRILQPQILLLNLQILVHIKLHLIAKRSFNLLGFRARAIQKYMISFST
jgi:hypothetical protein